MNKLIWFGFLFFPILFAASCNVGGNSPRKERTTKQVKAEWPLASLRETTETTGPLVFYGKTNREFFIEAASGVSLSKLVDLSMFGDFRPGLTIEQAATRFGSPIHTWYQRDKRYSIYKLGSVRIDVADEPYGSGGVTCHRRTVYAHPKPSSDGCSTSSAQLFHTSISAHIPKKDSIEVCVAEPGEGQRVWVLIREGCVESLNWWTPGSMGSCSDE